MFSLTRHLRIRPLFIALLAGMLGWGGGSARAEWSEETYPLVAGWNAIWLPLDTAHADLESHLADYPQIQEVWMWNPILSRSQFIASGALPPGGDQAWSVWRRDRVDQTSFSGLLPNAAYLIKVADGAPGFGLRLLGRPVPPRATTQGSGANFVGFPLAAPVSATTRNVERFFLFDPALSATPSVFEYVGGPLSAVAPRNPRPIVAVRTTALQRGRAYWIDSGVYSEYAGPLRVTISDEGVEFGAESSFVTLRIKNVTDPQDQVSVGFTLSTRASAPAPEGRAVVVGAPVLRVRGERRESDLRFDYTPVGSGYSRVLAPGEEAEIVLAVDRGAMTAPAGSRYASILQITDSLNLTRIDLPVGATVPSLAGVWVGTATIDRVDQIIGAERVAGARAPGGYDLRLILHRSASGEVKLLQKVYLSESPGEPARTVQPTVLAGVRRISSTAFPLNLVGDGVGQLAATGAVEFVVGLGYNAPTHPFVHTYHPDHDNLDARFSSVPLPDGVESQTIGRAITLRFESDWGDGEPGWGATLLGGIYEETITGLRAQTVAVSGSFALRRVSATPLLSNQP